MVLIKDIRRLLGERERLKFRQWGIVGMNISRKGMSFLTSVE